MKERRHATILWLIAKYPIDTQDALRDFLKKEGISVTQATLSRDINELKLYKSTDQDGRIRYQKHYDEVSVNEASVRKLKDYILSVEYSGNMVATHVPEGMGDSFKEALNELLFDGVLGHLADSDTVFSLTKTENDALLLCDYLRHI